MPKPVRSRKTQPSIHATAWGAWLWESSYGHMLKSLRQTWSMVSWNQGTLNSYLNEYSEWPLALDSQRSIIIASDTLTTECVLSWWEQAQELVHRADAVGVFEADSHKEAEAALELKTFLAQYICSTGMPGWRHQTQQDGFWSSITAIRSL